MILSKKCALKIFFNYTACFCRGYRSCKVVQEVNFKNIVVFSMKGMFKIEHVVFIEQKL